MLLPFFSYAILRSKRVQNYLADRIATYLSHELNTTISVGGVDVAFFMDIVLQDLVIKDQHKKILLYAKEMRVDIDKLNSFEKKIQISKIVFNKSDFNIVRYPHTDKFNYEFVVDYFKTSSKSKSNTVWKFSCKGFQLKMANLKYIDSKKNDTLLFNSFNPNQIVLSKINFNVSDINFENDTAINASIKNISFIEQSGFTIKKCKVDIQIKNKLIVLDDFYVKTQSSELSSDIDIILPDSVTATNPLIENTRFKCLFYPSFISAKEINFFIPNYAATNKTIEFSGLIKGSLANLKGKDIDVSYGHNSLFKGDVQFSGLPDIRETFMHLNIKEAIVDVNDLKKISFTNNSGTAEHIVYPEILNKLGQIIVKGRFTGFINDFVSYGSFNTDIGYITTDVSVKDLGENNGIECNGNIVGADVDVGAFTSTKKIGRMSFHSDIKAVGFYHTNRAKITGKLLVDSIVIANYRYKNIRVNGAYENKRFEGQLNMSDKNIDLSFSGLVDMSELQPIYDFTSQISHANLFALHIVSVDSSLELNSNIVMKFTGKELDDFTGRIDIPDLRIRTKKRDYNFNPVSLVVSKPINSLHKLDFNSDIVKANIEGNFSYQGLPGALSKFVSVFLPSLIPVKSDVLSQLNEQISFTIEVFDTKIISDIFMPSFKVAKNTKVVGSFASNSQQLSLDFTSSNVSFNNFNINDILLHVKTEGSYISLNMNASKALISDSVGFHNLSVNSMVKQDSLLYSVKWENPSQFKNEGQITGGLNIIDANTFNVNLNDSYIVLNDSLWTVKTGNLINIDSGNIELNNLVVSTQSQIIELNGDISTKKGTALKIGLTHVNLSNFDLITNKQEFDLDGIAHGDLQLTNVLSNPGVISNLDIKNFAVNSKLLGDAAIACEWEDEKKGLRVNIEVFYTGNIATSRPILVTGYFYPETTKENFDLDIYVANLNVKTLGRYFSSFTSSFTGYATGKAHLGGTLSDPALTGKIRVMGKSLKIDYLNTSYSFVHDVIIAQNYFYFENLEASDQDGNKAICTGKISHHNFYNWEIDIQVESKKILCLNTNIKDSEMYYGKGYVSGKASITGTAEHVLISANIKTEKGTQLFIPLNSIDEVSESGFISFKTKKEKTSIDITIPKIVDSGIEMKCFVEMTPEADVQLIFDEKVGDVIKGKGTGNMELNMSTSNEFTMFGEYTIYKGEYLFTLQNLINKHFDIEQGGVIRWNGDPYDALIDIKAVYSLRASLYDLISSVVIKNNSDSTSADKYKRRYLVECELGLQNKLFKPDIAFNIVLPNIDDETRRYVENVLSQDNQQEMSMQTFSLLVMNKFMQPAAVRENNLASGVEQAGATTSTEMLFNQVSNWLSSISKNFDVGVNYRPGDKLNNQELEVALSTQLFNDRVLIDGNIGTPLESNASSSSGSTGGGTSTSSNSSNIVGDVNIEYKLTQDGKFRVKAFNKSNHDDLLSELSSPYSQGMGISYRKDFNSVGDLFRRKKKQSLKTN